MILEEKLLRKSYDLHQILPTFGVDFYRFREDVEDAYLRLRKESGSKEEEIHAGNAILKVIERYKTEKAGKSSK